MEQLDLKTGDLILFDSNNSGILKIFDWIIKTATRSDYNHIGIVLKDPTYIKDDLKGLFLYESSWEGTPDPADGKIKLGVQITPLEEAIKNNKGKNFVRKLKSETEETYLDTFSHKNMLNVYHESNAKPYDINPKDWVEALFRIDPEPQKTGRFFCSALVGYVYTKLGILEPNTDWSILRPSDFSIEDENQHIDYINGFTLDDKQIELMSSKC
jgi:hypothetical protein